MMDKQVTLNKIEQLIKDIDALIPILANSNADEKAANFILSAKGAAIQIRQQIRKA
jgi:hypothetical protein